MTYFVVITMMGCKSQPTSEMSTLRLAVGVTCSQLTFTFHFHALEKEMATHSVFLPGESQEWWSLVGCHLWDCTESNTTEAT